MKLVVGLGNPGKKYFGTRHNVGFVVLERIVTVRGLEFSIKNKFEAEVADSEEVIYAKLTTYMNNSGEAVKKLRDFYKIEENDLFLVYDDLDIALGEYKIIQGKGPHDHNGVNSVVDRLGTDNFWHARIGVDGRTTENHIPGEDYVLMPFDESEMLKVEIVVEKVVADLKEKVGT